MELAWILSPTLLLSGNICCELPTANFAFRSLQSSQVKIALLSSNGCVALSLLWS
jgi:hypothetical protein